jgi:hypothetical protein
MFVRPSPGVGLQVDRFFDKHMRDRELTRA